MNPNALSENIANRESLEFDIVIIGAGPSGLSAAIRIAQLNQEHQTRFSIAVLEKASDIGGHLLSGAVFEPRALNELIPDWQAKGAPLKTQVTQDNFYWLSARSAKKLPKIKALNNQGNYIISLNQFAKWLAQQAESLGVHLFTGFAAKTLLFNENQSQVIGVLTEDKGLDKNGDVTSRYQAGMALYAKQTLFAEGCRGHLSQTLMRHFNLRKHCSPQTYAIGVKELWEIDASQCNSGSVIHSVGWPLDNHTYGGGFMYQWNTNKVAVGVIIGLDYRNPYLDPFEELQQLKRHPLYRKTLEGGLCIHYGARALNEGGWQSIPQLTFPGGMLIGCSAGFVNVGKIKGNHTAMKSGMLAAEAIFASLNQFHGEIATYNKLLKNSWVGHELYLTRNIRPAFNYGLWSGLCYTAFDQIAFRGKAPWTFTHHADYLSLKFANQVKKKIYPPADGKLTFKKLDQVFLCGVNHRHDQPCHLQLKDQSLALKVNLARYDCPESRYCPAGVYEIVEEDQKKRLQINFQNCLHCKTCDIKDPTQNIIWTPPEGGDGPNYAGM